jgi:hypothetical protein
VGIESRNRVDAPPGPQMHPLQARSASSMIGFSCQAKVLESENLLSLNGVAEN